jgi:hypothetical protein
VGNTLERTKVSESGINVILEMYDFQNTKDNCSLMKDY